MTKVIYNLKITDPNDPDYNEIIFDVSRRFPSVEQANTFADQLLRSTRTEKYELVGRPTIDME